ncbi:MAG: type II toxin-antitoxin system Phd/YefM family antitoxin [Clostridiales bacterium]|nr:type II toxin-antitoxin system Phd/YefM family antitoxin [Oscillospiraceae bacterium]MCD8340675.1 type II toxin-antitoxin system Phd/YefM family antitoxin [Clostridiales bacterium]
MIVTATEFKTNFGKYLDMLLGEDIFVTRNGKVVAKVVNPNVSAVDTISGMLAGKLPDEYDARAMREERLNRYAFDD